jgi:hypothetical protein
MLLYRLQGQTTDDLLQADFEKRSLPCSNIETLTTTTTTTTTTT